MAVTVGDVIEVLDAAYPPGAAESWDTGIGLTCGDRRAAAGSILLAVDVNRAVVRQAREVQADLLISHHPLLFRPVQSVATDTVKGALLHDLIRVGIAHFAAHTNADKASGGVNDALAAALGLVQVSALDAAAPSGLGRLGVLPESLPLSEFATLVGRRLPTTAGGVRFAGAADRLISAVAVCGGAGGSLLPAAAAAGADVFVSSDMSHHVVAEFCDSGNSCAVVDVAHWASEWPWLPMVADVLRRNFPGLAVIVSDLQTDPWTGRC